MKAVLDTNVVVSGLLSPFGAAGEIMRLAASGDIELCYDARILSEYRDVLLRRKFAFLQEEVENLLDQIIHIGHLTTGKPLAERLPDRDDEPFLEVAIGSGAKYLVTGNLKHYPSDRRKGVKILSPSSFLEVCRKNL